MSNHLDSTQEPPMSSRLLGCVYFPAGWHLHPVKFWDTRNALASNGHVYYNINKLLYKTKWVQITQIDPWTVFSVAAQGG